MAVNGVVGAKYLLTRIGNSYEKEDCVNAVVTNLIHNCPGGDKAYRTAGCTELWNSVNKSGKYKHVTSRMTLSEAKRDGLLIGDLPVIYDENTGTCEHIAYYMGGIGGYECIHSSKTKGCVCGTTLKNGFTHVLRHRDIIGVPASMAGNYSSATDKEASDKMDGIGYATVSTKSGPLNMRASAEKTNNIINEIPNKTRITVIRASENGWTAIYYGGMTGYVASEYLVFEGSAGNGSSSGSKPNADTWGVFVPCASNADAQALASHFSAGIVTSMNSMD